MNKIVLCAFLLSACGSDAGTQCVKGLPVLCQFQHAPEAGDPPPDGAEADALATDAGTADSSQVMPDSSLGNPDSSLGNPDSSQPDATATCDPVANTGCSGGAGCYVTGVSIHAASDRTACVNPPGTAAIGAFCDTVTACAPRLTCANDNYACQLVCRLGDPNSCISLPGKVCTPMQAEGGGFTMIYGVCQ